MVLLDDVIHQHPLTRIAAQVAAGPFSVPVASFANLQYYRLTAPAAGGLNEGANLFSWKRFLSRQIQVVQLSSAVPASDSAALSADHTTRRSRAPHSIPATAAWSARRLQ